MAYKLTITEEADRQFKALPVHDQKVLKSAILARLQHQPMTETNAVKRLRPNQVAEFELRAGNLRVLYNIEADEVVILIVGTKSDNKLIVEGEEFHAHQDDPPEHPRERS